MTVRDDLTTFNGKQLVTISMPRDTSAETYDVIFNVIKEFESKVPDTHVPCANFVVRPYRVVLTKVKYFFPDILIFYGQSLADGAFDCPTHISANSFAVS